MDTNTPIPYTIDQLSENLDHALRAIKSGQPTMWEAKQIAQHFRDVFVDQTRDLFPPHEGREMGVAGKLAVVQELELALDRLRVIGVSPKTRLRDIPSLDTALRHSLDEAAAGRPGGISFR
ncbi:hypothetical protein [Chromobacterium violaceum]|uniref:Uncharacterized protein n=1 Tax=Chromobacterium violaceum TaxID=536 RepID=A0A202B343_CHRVL|nr:hypothetical protein [Chromobacterium violaceum]OVE45924.1 hypothetical protein CBW21_21020 [Chromobacterium violaceum]